MLVGWKDQLEPCVVVVVEGMMFDVLVLILIDVLVCFVKFVTRWITNQFITLVSCVIVPITEGTVQFSLLLTIIPLTLCPPLN